MKRCPNCNRTYTKDAQKFCTQDGTPLIDAQTPSAGQDETIRIDSSQLNATQIDGETTRPISRELVSETSSGFEPFKTVINEPQETATDIPRDTHLTPPPVPPPSSGSSATSSGAIQPPATSPQPPPAQRTPSGQISLPAPTAAPTPEFAPRTPAPARPATAPRPAKRSKLPLVLGILAVLLLIGPGAVAVGYFFVLRPMLEARRVIVEPTPTPSATPIAKTTPKPKESVVKEAPPYQPSPGAVEFVNSRDKLDSKLKEHYVDFSFYYPDSWQKDPTAGVPGATNFAQVERRLPPNNTQESFAVGWYSSAGSKEGDRAVFHTLAENLSAQYQKSFPEYRKVSEGPTRAGVYDGYQFRFESVSRNTDKGDIKIWGRVIFVPPVDGGNSGVTLLMLATSLAPELKNVNDVGVKGQLPMMLESFRFGSR